MATVPEIAVFVFCLIGCGITAWNLGVKAGVNGTIAYLAQNGIIEVTEEE